MRENVESGKKEFLQAEGKRIGKERAEKEQLEKLFLRCEKMSRAVKKEFLQAAGIGPRRWKSDLPEKNFMTWRE